MENKHLQGALTLVGINADDRTIDLIIEVYKSVEELGGKFDVDTAVNIKLANLTKYGTPPEVPAETAEFPPESHGDQSIPTQNIDQ